MGHRSSSLFQSIGLGSGRNNRPAGQPLSAFSITSPRIPCNHRPFNLSYHAGDHLANMAPHSSSPPSALSLADSPDLHEKELGEATTASPSTLPVLKKVAGLGVMLLVVFWLNAAWLLGSYVSQDSRIVRGV